MKNITKNIIATIMIMVMVLTGVTPTITAEAKSTKTSITVLSSATGKAIGKKTSLKVGGKLQLALIYNNKIITNKAKYKTSNKNVTVSKKGKITAKTAGTCTVTITYKKKTKKIKVKVTGKATTKKIIIESETKNNPHPKCGHEWECEFYSDKKLDFYTDNPSENFFANYREHLFLYSLYCPKCDTVAYTQAIPISSIVNEDNEIIYTNANFANIITGYMPYTTYKYPKHTHTKRYMWDRNDDGSWSGGTKECIVCHKNEF